MPQTFYIAQQGKETFSVSEQDFRDMIFRGELLPEDYYFIEGMENWTRVADYRPKADVSQPPPMSMPTRRAITINKPGLTKPAASGALKGLGIAAAVIAGIILLALISSSSENNRSSNRTVLSELGRQAQENMELAKNGKVRIGMITEQCEIAWGKPERINYTRNKYGTSEQWCYASGSYLYFENEVLVSIQKSK